MSTTRPYPAGDRGQEPEGAAATAAVPDGRERLGMQQVRRLRLIGASGVVPRARDFTRKALEDWGWLPAVTAEQRAAAEDVLLVVSELVTNGVRHVETHDGDLVELRVKVEARTVRVEVRDPGRDFRPPRAVEPPPEALGGRGLLIVDRVAARWGVTPGPRTVVWFELDRPR